MQFDQKVLRALRYTVTEEDTYKFLYAAIPIFRALFSGISDKNRLDNEEDLLWIQSFSTKVVEETLLVIKEMENEQ